MSLPNPTFMAPRPVAATDTPVREVSGTDQPKLVHGSVTVTLELIAPEIAKDWLERYNTHNRRLDPSRTRAMARDQQDGNWYFIGDAIRFAEWRGQQVMIDGQHRLAAIVQSGEPQMYIVVRGLSIEAQEAVDTGKVRTFAHTLAMEVDEEGNRVWSDENNVGAINRRLLMWERGYVTGLRTGGGNSGQITKAEQRTYLEDHKREILDGIQVLRAAKSAATPLNIPPSVVASAWVLLARKDRTGADVFVVEYLCKGLNIIDQASPQAALRKRLTRTDIYRPSVGEGFLLILKAWNHWRKGETITKLQAPRDGWPKPEDFGIL